MSKLAKVPTGILVIDDMLDGGFQRGSLVVVGGPPGVGKSTLLLQLANSIALDTGERVVFATDERNRGSVVDIRYRLQVAGKLHQGKCPVKQHFSEDVDAITRFAEADGARVLVVDPFETTSSGEARHLREFATTLNAVTLVAGNVPRSGRPAKRTVLDSVADLILSLKVADTSAPTAPRVLHLVKGAKRRVSPLQMVMDAGVFRFDAPPTE